MKQRTVVFSRPAQADLGSLYEWLAGVAGPETALRYVNGITDYCRSLGLGSHRGHLRNDLREGLRVVGYKRRVTILFTVEDKRVVILRIFYGGRNWEPLMRED